MRHIKGMAAITNPLVNSYKRLVPGFEAPVYIAWSTTNRSPLIRIPATADGEGTRIELRSPDSAANPYLTLAVCLSAGLQGIREKILPPRASMRTFCTDRQRAERAEHRPAAGHFAGGSGRTGEGYLYPGCLRRPYCRKIHRCQAQGMA